MGWGSIYVLGHNCIEIFKTDFAIFIAVCFLQHQSQGFSVQILFHMVVHIFKIIQCQVVFVVSVVFFENWCNHFLVLVTVRLSIHCLHKLYEWNTTSLFAIEFCYYFVGCFSVRDESILSQQQFDVVGEEYSHPGCIVGIENLFEVDYVLVSKTAGDVEWWFKFSEILSFESDTVVVRALNSGFAFIGTVSELLWWISHLAATASPEGAGLLLGYSHRHD